MQLTKSVIIISKKYSTRLAISLICVCALIIFRRRMSYPTTQPFEDLDYTNVLKLEDEHEIKIEFTKNAIVTGFIVWLNLYIDEEELIDTLAERYIWLPIYLPVFYNDTRVEKGDYIDAKISRQLAENGLNPDFTITGTLYRKNQGPVDFTFKSPNHEKSYRNSPFYQNLFANDTVKIRENFSIVNIKTDLKKKLPLYMMPSHIIPLESMPLTVNGKIDRKALPDPDPGAHLKHQYVAPRTEMEQALSVIWQDLLSAERVGVNDNFFELGGHSLLVTRVISAIRKQFNSELRFKDIFAYPTIGELCVLLQRISPEESAPPIIAIEHRPERIPLSFSQERLWFIDRLEGSVQYHMPSVLTLKGRLNREALEKTFHTIINRHEVLRTVIIEHEGQGYQYVNTVDNWSLGFIEISDKNGKAPDLSVLMMPLIGKPFDLSADYMLRADLLKIDDQDHILLATMHHIASDGWSRSILINEVKVLYQGYAENIPPELPGLEVQYADYAIWQRQYMQGELLENKLGYWKTKLEGVATLQLPTDYSRPSIQRSAGARSSFELDGGLSGQLTDLSQRYGVTLYMTLLSVFKILLYRYSGQDDICVGTPIAGRDRQEIEGLIGFFINTLALRSRVSGDMSFTALLEEIKATTLEAYSHQEVPFEKVVDAVVKDRDMSRSPLFQVMFSLQNTPDVPELTLGELELTAEGQENVTSKFDISLFFKETSTGIHGTIEYATDLYIDESIERMIGHYINLLESIVSTPEKQVSHLGMLGIAEQQRLLSDFNDTDVEYATNRSIIGMFEEQAEKAPGAIAIVFGEERLTYGELNEWSNQLARYLQQQGVKAETLVPVCVERGMEMIIGILGILKAGAAYVPVDPEYPQDRVSYMLEDTGAELVLSSKASREKLQGNAKVIELDGEWEQIAKEQSGNLGTVILPGELAYVIYTSGSTGRPKGVMIEHRSASAFINWSRQEFSNSHFDIVYAVTSICFDLSVFELFYPLSIGKPVRILENGLAITNYVSEDTAILINTVPTVIEHLINEKSDLGNVSVINMAGEPIPSRVLEGLDTTKIEVRNLYGPSEDTTYSTICKLENGKAITIGKPISNTKVYILNNEKALSPMGVAGEICIGGAGLARGYHNRPELTDEKFINNPFSKEEGSRLYRTGDLGKWLPDGNIEYLGRIDDQVKIRGYRIELGEIESVLNQSGQVNQAVVLAKADQSGNKRLVGYIVPKEGFDKQATHDYLSSKLPDYMVPAIWVALESLPLTPNGKIDKKGLPDPELTDMAAVYVAPRNETEAKLVAIWQAFARRGAGRCI